MNSWGYINPSEGRKVRFLVLTIVAIALGIGSASCSIVRGDPAALYPRAEEGAQICFHVADGSTLKQLEGVEILLVSSEGLRPIGVTPRHGVVCVPKHELQREHHGALLFCREGFFCGAFRLDKAVAGREFLEFDERFIVLAPFMLL